jgi:hypothetical protein
MNILFGPIPRGFIECNIKSIETRGGIASHFLDKGVHLIEIRGRISKRGEIWVRKRRRSRRRGRVLVWLVRGGLGGRLAIMDMSGRVVRMARWIGSGEDGLEIGGEGCSNLIRSSRVGAI